MEVRSPLDLGLVDDWEALEAVWAHGLSLLRAGGSGRLDHPLLVAEPAFSVPQQVRRLRRMRRGGRGAAGAPGRRRSAHTLVPVFGRWLALPPSLAALPRACALLFAARKNGGAGL